jgi:transposase
MNSEEPKCGDDCKLVEMLASRTSIEQVMENAIAAVQTGKMSEYAAAKLFKVNRQTLRNRLSKNGVHAKVSIDTVPSESAPAKPKKADQAERDHWWADYQAGMGIKTIASKYGRGNKTIAKEINSRNSNESEFEATQGPPVNDQPVTPTGELNDHMKALVKRESKSSKDRLKIVAALKEIQIPLEKTMRAASKEFRFGRGIVYQDVMAAERQLAKDGNPSIRETLEEVAREAESVRKFATESLRLLQLDRDEA